MAGDGSEFGESGAGGAVCALMLWAGARSSLMDMLDLGLICQAAGIL